MSKPETTAPPCDCQNPDGDGVRHVSMTCPVHTEISEDDAECPECGEAHEGACAPPHAWFLALTEAEQIECIAEMSANV